MCHSVGSFVAIMIKDSFHVKILLCSWVARSVVGSKSDSNGWSGFLGAVSCGDNPLRMNQRSSAERKAWRWSELRLPWPSSFRGRSTTNNSCSRFVSTLSWSTAAAATITTTTTQFTTLLAVRLHVSFKSPLAESSSGPWRAIAVLVLTTVCDTC